MLSVKNLVKTYKSKKAETVYALNGVSIDFEEKGFVFLLGKSGSGKSTLLNTIGGLDKFDSGEIIIKGRSSKTFSQSDFDSYRNTFIGFIFQEYNVLENFTVAKNLGLALELQGKKASKEEVNKLLSQVDMLDYAKRKPNELSGGQKQRVAIARALIKNPEIIMADEPTGALDSATGKQVMDTLKELSKTKLVIVVSHDREFAELYGDRIIELKDGKIISDVTKKEIVPEETKSGIKIIDDNIVYIKKGQEISPSEMNELKNFIEKNSKNADTFISFDAKANQKLKEGAKINDEGNKEKFMETQKEDIEVKKYNPKSLKLIRSHLSFRDSFKMGASSLKTKVGKLFFTILLSFFAFTVFGVVDALSQWNRANSVYQAMQMTNQTTMVMRKEKKITQNGYSYNNKVNVTEADIEYFKDNFPDYVVKGGVSSSYGGITKIKIVSDSSNPDSTKDLSDTTNPFKTAGFGGFVTLTQDELTKLGLSMYKGNLPANDDEIAISKFNADNIISATAKWDTPITYDNIIDTTITFYSRGSNTNYKIVGIVDDGTDFSQYSNVTDEALNSDYQKSYQYQNMVQYSFASLGYVTQEVFNGLTETTSGDYLYYKSSRGGYSSLDKSSYITDVTLNSYSSVIGTYTKTGSDDTLTIGNGYYLFKKVDNATNTTTYYRYNGGSSVYLCDENGDATYSSGNELSMEEFDAIFLGFNSNEYHIPTGFTKVGAYLSWLTNDMYEDTSGEFALYGSPSDYIGADGNLSLEDDEVIISQYLIGEGLDSVAEKIRNGTMYITILESYSDDAPVTKELKVVGMAENFGGDEYSLLVSKATQTKMRGYYGAYNFMISKLNGSSKDEDFVKACEVFNSNNVKYTIQNAQTSTLDMFESIITTTATVFFYIAIAFAVFAALLLMSFITTSISYKKREIGVLRALGARGSDVFGIFLNESLIIATINFVLATIATIIGGGAINSAIIKELGVTIPLLNVGLRQIVLIWGVSWGSAIVASFIPTMKISKKKPIDAINNR